MRERTTFERELREGEGPLTDILDNLRLGGRLFQCARFKAIQDGVSEAVLSGGAIKGKPCTVTVRYYRGTTPSVALVFAGVHGNEDEGIITATAIQKKLDTAYAAKPRKLTTFHTFLIENLRAARDTIDPASKIVRWVDNIEPNRNFPLPGEGITAALDRNKKLGFDLVDPDVRRFPNLSPRMPSNFTPRAGKTQASKLIIPENRILLDLIACIKPSRAASLHSHGVKNARGDGPGVFVDPRGGFDTDLDAPLTAEGRIDDMLADRLLKAAITGLKASKLPKQQQIEALQGNQPGSRQFFGETVHYSYGAPKARGTSFGMWASAPIRAQGNDDRNAMQTITLELPKWLEKNKKKETDMIADLWADILIQHFLELR